MGVCQDHHQNYLIYNIRRTYEDFDNVMFQLSVLFASSTLNAMVYKISGPQSKKAIWYT